MSFSRALSNIFKLVPHTKISLINGYIRENTESNFDVPKEIVHLCALSAFPVAGFAKDHLGCGLAIYWNHVENTFCEAMQTDRLFVDSAFGKIKATECGRYRWTIRIIYKANGALNDFDCMFGIIEDDKNILWKVANTFFTAERGSVYAYDIAAKMIRANTNQKKYVITEQYGDQNIVIEKGLNVNINLDLDQNTLGFGVNDNDFGIAFKNIPKKVYRIAISIPWGMAVQITDAKYYFN